MGLWEAETRKIVRELLEGEGRREARISELGSESGRDEEVSGLKLSGSCCEGCPPGGVQRGAR